MRDQPEHSGVGLKMDSGNPRHPLGDCSGQESGNNSNPSKHGSCKCGVVSERKPERRALSTFPFAVPSRSPSTSERS